MRADGAGYDEIAKAVGVAYGTAYNAAKNELIKSDKLIGDDGKFRPATYERRAEVPQFTPGLFVPGGR